MKKNIILLCLIDDLARKLAQEVSSEFNISFFDLTKTFKENKINSKADLNKSIKDSFVAKISTDQLNVMKAVKNAIFVSNNFNLLSEKFLDDLKSLCIVVYMKVNKEDYLEYKWTENINKKEKFKVETKVFDFRQLAYSSCVDIVLDASKNIKTLSRKLIKYMESL